MKKLIIIYTLCSSLIALATIDESTFKKYEPTQSEVDKSRSCFKELERMGCGHPREDLQHFKSCKDEVKTSLSLTCKQMITDLYDKRK
jgi:hypothetical protein